MAEKISITETGITEIGFKFGSQFNPTDDGTVKWFRDEMDQDWVKFKILGEQNRTRRKVTYVIPAREVLYVRY